MTAPFTDVTDILVIMRRLLKTASDQSITDDILRDALNRFYIYDVPQDLQLFELKRVYQFETLPNVHLYDFPYNDYQLIRPPVYADGSACAFFQSQQLFNNVFPEFIFNQNLILGNGGVDYDGTVTQTPLLRGFTDQLGYRLPNVIISATSTTGNRLYITDDGTLNTTDVGELYETPSDFQFPNPATPPTSSGTVNYATGALDFTFSEGITAGSNIQVQTVNYSAGWPRAVLFFNNIIKLYPVPDKSYKMQFDAQITPAQFLSNQDAIPFGYMGEYLAYGGALKLMAETADTEQFNFYYPMFKEKEAKVLRRTNRQQAVERTPTIFSAQTTPTPNYYTQY